MKIESNRVRIWGRWWTIASVNEKRRAWPHDGESITVLMVKRDDRYRRVVLDGHGWPVVALED